VTTQGAAPAPHLLVRLGGGRVYGLPVTAIREVVAWTRPRRLPSALPHLRGVVELRGSVVPVFDLAGPLGAPATEVPTLIAVLDHDEPVGVLLEGVDGIRELAVQRPARKRRGALVAGLAVVGDDVVEALDAAACLKALRPPRRRRRPPAAGRGSGRS
jgi:purine-binding chemotaxis protein CheW